MKRTPWIFLLAAVLVAGFAGAAQAQDGLVTVKALMIRAQNDSAPIDRRLEKVEYKLRRVFGFQFYKYVGEGSVSFAGRGNGVIELPGEHRVQIRVTDGSGRAEVRWLRGGQALLSTSVSIGRQAPVVLGGIPDDGGRLIVVLTRE